MKHLHEKRNLSLKVDQEINDIYKLGRKNGWDVSEIARRAISEEFKKLEPELKRPAT